MAKHSPLGASGAERWMNCPGSVALIQALGTGDTSDEADYTREGTAAHEVAAACLREDREAWEFIGSKAENGVDITLEITNGIDVYVEHCHKLKGGANQVFIEHHISAPDVHEDFYGTVDFGAVYHEHSHLAIRDFKNGAGVVVEADDNPQLMYYAYGILHSFDDIRSVSIGIVQPNAFHVDGPIRIWETRAEHISEWVHDVLVPAMHRTAADYTLDPGPWCRFCPAKLICPALTCLFKAAIVGNVTAIPGMTDEDLGRSYQYIKAVEMYVSALEKETYARLMRGKDMPGVKLVNKRAHRVWRDEAKALAVEKFGDDAMEPATLKSPAELEKLSAAAKAFVKEHAFKPESGLTVALEADNRPAVKVQTTQETFSGYLNQLANKTE